jgi:hypothetical protein
MKAYTRSKTLKTIVLTLCGLIMLGMGYFLTMMLLREGNHHSSAFNRWFGASFLLLIFVFVIFILLEAWIGTLFIGQEGVSFVGIFKKWEMSFSEIRGYRIGDKFILIEPIAKEKKKISIRISLPGTAQLITLLESRYEDLDVLEKEEGYKAIMDNSRYGKSIEERKEKLEDATGISKLINATGVLILLLGFIPKTEKYLVVIAIAAPVVFLIVLRIYNGLIRIDWSKSSPYPSIPFGLAAVIICLIIKCLRYSILDYHAVWQPALFAGMVLVAVLMVGNRNFYHIDKARILGIVLITLCSFVYGICTTVTVNCLYDTSNSRYYRARVLDKWVSRGRSTTYHFRISRWSDEVEEDNIRVSRAVFNRVNIEDPMNVYVYAGKLKIPWYVVTDQ